MTERSFDNGLYVLQEGSGGKPHPFPCSVSERKHLGINTPPSLFFPSPSLSQHRQLPRQPLLGIPVFHSPPPITPRAVHGRRQVGHSDEQSQPERCD